MCGLPIPAAHTSLGNARTAYRVFPKWRGPFLCITLSFDNGSDRIAFILFFSTPSKAIESRHVRRGLLGRYRTTDVRTRLKPPTVRIDWTPSSVWSGDRFCFSTRTSFSKLFSNRPRSRDTLYSGTSLRAVRVRPPKKSIKTFSYAYRTTLVRTILP